MDDGILEAMVADAEKTVAGRVKVAVILGDLQKLAPMLSDPQTRPAAEAALAKWDRDGVDPLRKALAAEWIARAAATIGKTAHTAVVHPTVTGLRAVMGAYKAGARGASNLGAAVGEKVATSPLLTGRRNAAMAAGRQKGEAAMATRFDTGGAVRRNQGPTLMEPGSGAAPSASDAAAAATRSGIRQNAINGAGDIGAASAGQSFAAAGAKRGREVGGIAYKLGLGAAAVAGAGALDAGQNSRRKKNQMSLATPVAAMGS